MPDVLISDPTLRDGNHAVRHTLSEKQISTYAAAAEAAGVPILEVGHGNGLGASSLQVGLCSLNDAALLDAARAPLRNTRLGVHVMPGFATIGNELTLAIEHGVQVFRVACHCTEADITQRHVSFLREKGADVYGALMMSHMADAATLVEEGYKMQQYGVNGVILYDSAGAMLPDEVRTKIAALTRGLGVQVGLHAHNNLGMSVANSVAALEAGATILDGTARGFGAGAGNTQLEVLVAVLHKLGHDTGIDLYKLLDLADLAEREIIPAVPTISGDSIASGLAGVFSGFAKHVKRVAAEYGVDSRDVWFELGRRHAVAGQEDQIIEVALQLAAAAGKSNGEQ
ncbi:MAG: 4-hydroxy-2-oxovalerate aldolase [Desulfovibrionaceae bacterium]|jgi:4-hydroxy 2-oxovalerate aldolase|nr:4-hydroxy-2-oxovalerate aldolase [Desulfovibrionaceae bacterium]